MDDLVVVLEELGLDLAHVIAARAFPTCFGEDYDRMNAVYRSHFAAGRLSARTCIGVTALARGARVEIDFIARRPGSRSDPRHRTRLPAARRAARGTGAIWQERPLREAAHEA